MTSHQKGRYITRTERMRRRKRRRRMKRLLFAAEVATVLFFCYLLFAAIPKGMSNLQRARRVDAYAKEQTFSETGTRRSAQIVEETVPAKGIVILDAGHGGKDVGCLRGGTYEKDINLAIARIVRTRLEEEGYRVVMVRDDDTFYELYERASCANQYEGRDDAVFISIHVNAMEDDASVSGIECYANRSAHASSPLLADAVAEGVSGETGARLRKTEADSDLYVVSHALIPSCLIEVGFLTSDTEYALLTDPAYQNKIASGIVSGADTFFNAQTVDN